MPVLIRSHRRFPAQCSGTYNAGTFQGQGTLWKLSMRRVFFTVVLVLAGVTGAVAGSFEDGLSAVGRGDFMLAARLYRPLAEQGNASAQAGLGAMYASGQGVPLDYQEAVKWYREAAQQGNAQAQVGLGVMYVQGRGVPQDAQEAVKWYRRAAKQGDGQAQYGLGLMYDTGRGVPKDFMRAHMWYTVSATALSGDSKKNAMEHRAHVTSQMMAAQIEKAKEMAWHCQETKFKDCD
jgi:TPR repeat protein